MKNLITFTVVFVMSTFILFSQISSQKGGVDLKNWSVGDTVKIEWNNDLFELVNERVNIEIWNAATFQKTIIVEDLSEFSSEYTWIIPYNTIPSMHNRIIISNSKNSTGSEYFPIFIEPNQKTNTWNVVNKEQNINIHPNPVSDILNIQNIEIDAIRSISIFNNLSNLEQSINTGFNSINVSDLSAGVYFLQIEYINGESEVHKFMKI